MWTAHQAVENIHCDVLTEAADELGAEKELGVSSFPAVGLWPYWQGFLGLGHLTFSPPALGASTYFSGDGHGSPLAGGDICSERGGHCTMGGDGHRCVMLPPLYSQCLLLWGGTLKHNQHCKTITQAGHAGLLLRSLQRGDCLC